MEPTRPRLAPLVTVGLALAVALTAGLLTLLGPGAVPVDADGARAATSDPGLAGTTPGDRSGTAADGSPYRFWALDRYGAPLRWDPCTPIGFVLNPAGAPPDAELEVRTALAILADATGMELELLGHTDESPASARPLVEADGSGWRWRSVLVSWIPTGAPGPPGGPLGPLDRGVAVPVAVRDGDREAYVTGQVILNASRSDLVSGSADRRTAIAATLLHELAHLLGLDHVDDPTQMMWDDPGTGPVELGAGDLAGLALLGRAAGCNPAPDPRAGRGLVFEG